MGGLIAPSMTSYIGGADFGWAPSLDGESLQLLRDDGDEVGVGGGLSPTRIHTSFCRFARPFPTSWRRGGRAQIDKTCVNRAGAHLIPSRRQSAP